MLDPAALEFVEGLAEDLTEFEVLQEDWPLAAVKLWDRQGFLDVAEEAGPEFVKTIGERIRRTSQRSAVALLAANRTVVIGGGNRSGKTFGTKAAVLALGLGSDHPMARAFWKLNGIDPDVFPTGPCNADHNDGEVWIVAVDSNASKEYHRSSIEVLLPPGSYRWRNRDGSGAAELYVDCPGYSYPAIFRFKSDGPGARKRMQGQKCRAIWHDEEGPSDEAWDECCTRLTDTNGWHILSNTPVDGVTWVESRLIAKTDPEKAELEAVTYHIHSIDNPHLSPAGRRNLRKGDKRIRLAKMFGRAVAREGLVYPMLDTNTHVVEPFEVPRAWLRYKMVDFGTRAPFACVWMALCPGAWIRDGKVLDVDQAEDVGKQPGDRWIPDDTLVVYREYEKTGADGTTLKGHALRMRELEGWVIDWDEGTWKQPPKLEDGTIPVEHFEMCWADPEDPQQMLQLIRDYDMPFVKAVKHVNLGIDAVNERLDPGGEGPGLLFFSTCPITLREHRGYSWAPKTATTEPDRPLKKDDHTCDCVRYGVYGVKRGAVATSRYGDD